METIFAYPPVPQTGQRALMACFSSGQEHSRRLSYTLKEMARIKVDVAQSMAAEATRKAAAAGTVDVVPLAREVITGVLEELLGLPDGPDADAEIAANRVGIVLQARDATAGLIANALLHHTSLEETLPTTHRSSTPAGSWRGKRLSSTFTAVRSAGSRAHAPGRSCAGARGGDPRRAARGRAPAV